MYTFVQPVIDLLASILQVLFHFVQDWGIAIILLTLFVRGLLFPLSLRTARQTMRQALIRPELKLIQERHKEDQAKAMEETMKLYQRAGIKPLSMFTTSILQMPIFMAMYGLFLSHGASMSSSFIPWVASFAQVDQWHILPALAAGLTFVTSLIPLTSEMVTDAPLFPRIASSLVMVVVFLLILWKAPVALGLYWTSGSLFGLLERGFYRSPLGKKILLRGRPELITSRE
ncbi:YidC/Oxa1 family membrane protein insertase [Brevibacillus ruminantium]|uniref:YidC/Oxa1 family membrane protein insertase n=1 Tax=Brevibacillus ruminantium TaxID=2950604 RepID=A0ABY4WK76_9BACL|nr:YidC/Oxa1 family membrane protein insertase [Brevibacillus ruminantium]USG67443.1 YidC/Oxa1 family membrane protein insertase [Brevibacillus ruminantium]